MSGSHAPTSTDRLVDELATRLRRIDLVGWSRITGCAGQELVATLDRAHRAGIQAYVAELSPEERRRLESALEVA